MKYSDLVINAGFQKNMRETNWLKLFPTWWSENDPLLNAIGQEIAYIKAQAIFELLNITLKPPVMLWQESINHKKYTESFTINQKNDDLGIFELIKLPAPRYKTFGTIKITNRTIDDISNLQIALNDVDYITILDTITTDDEITINVGSQKVYINKDEANIIKNGDGLSYFKVGAKRTEMTPIININVNQDNSLLLEVDTPKDFIGNLVINREDDLVFFDGQITEEDLGHKIIETPKLKYPNENIFFNFTNSDNYFDVLYTSKDKELQFKKIFEPLHNESINLIFSCEDVSNINIDVDVIFDNVVFIDEQNIEVTGLELIPIEKIEMYALYDFPHNLESNGWRKVYEKKYDEETNVIYDMITTHLYTKKFYVEAYFKGLDYPYKVGFPAYKNAKSDSIYHINKHIDEWGKYFGLKRREYRTEIPDEDYPFTYPPYYPFDIEQDYWYYQRLVNEYTWNDLAINEVDLIDTNGDPIVRLHSIDPFVQDFVVYANSHYPEERENIDYSIFTPNNVSYHEPLIEAPYKKSPYYDTQNLLHYDNNKAYVTLANKKGTHISSQVYMSKPLKTNFDLTYLPEDIDIDDISVIVEAEVTDNNIDRYSNSDTGIIIHGIDNERIFKMTQSENYTMEERKIEYHLSDSIENIKKEIHQYDENVLHTAIIKPFSTKQGSYVNIPFILKENDTIVDDITEVYITYDDIKTYEGEYKSNDKGRYIRVWLPLSTKEYTTMRVACKSNKYNSFSVGNIELKTTIKEETIDDIEEEVSYISGPILNGQEKAIYVEDEWHTADLRNIIQKDSISFVNTFENDNETNTPTFLIKNIQLKINHKEKKSKFELKTQINKKDVQQPNIAQLLVTIKNTGTTQLLTNVDIVHADNIKLSENYINVDLNIGESTTTIIDITPEYPILDGQYDILTMCEDKTCHNTIVLSGSGLLQTGTKIEQTYGIYNQPIWLSASIIHNDIKINEGKVSFYVDNFKIEDFEVINGKAEGSVSTENSKIMTPGIHTLEARFSGTEKYASSRILSSLIITKDKTNIELDAKSTIVYDTPYTINTYITSNEENIKEGLVELYLNNEKIGSKDVINGQASFIFSNFVFEPNEYLLKAVYIGTNNYAKEEITQTITIIGGETQVIVSENNGKPGDTILLKANVKNVHNIPISDGTIQFAIIDDNGTETKIEDKAIIKNGIAEIEYYIDANILEESDYNDVKIFTIKAYYTDEQECYKDSEGTNTLTIQRGNVIIKCNNIFFGSQYEPLGFLIQVNDTETGKPVTDGTIEISIPNLDIDCPSTTLDHDGYARIIYNPLKFTADDFDQLLHFYFKEGKLLPCKDANGENIKLYVGDNELTNFVDNNLYCIYDGNLEDLNLMDFNIVENNNEKHLIYEIKDRDGLVEDMEQIFVDDNGHLYARTTLDSRDIRRYQEGNFPINITYTSESKYKNKNQYNTIEMTKSIVNLDVHSQKIKYNDVNKSVICYVTEYNLENDQNTNIINDGQVIFFIDNQKVNVCDVVNGIAILPSDELYKVQYGSHLLTAEYTAKNKPNTYTYADIYVEPITSTIEYNKKIKEEKLKLTVSVAINNQYQIPITGNVDIYLDNKIVTSKYLFGIEDMEGNISDETYNATHIAKTTLDFVIDVPKDINITQHTLTIKYTGDRHILPSEQSFILEKEKLPIDIKTEDVYVAQDNFCEITYDINTDDNDFVNDGEISIWYGSVNKTLKAKGYVKNNKATLRWLVDDDPDKYFYTVEFSNSSYYIANSFLQKIIVVEPYDDVYISHNENDKYLPKTFTNLQEALQCVKNGKNIHIIDYVNIDSNIIIDKDINIIGHNNSKIQKDLEDLLPDNKSVIKEKTRVIR